MARPDVSVLLDWRQAKVYDPQPCFLCDRPAFLRHPHSPSTPCHKVCADAQANQTSGNTITNRSAQ
jgi:hypothetical protein